MHTACLVVAAAWARVGPVVDPTADVPEPAVHLVAEVRGTVEHPALAGTFRFRTLGRRVELVIDGLEGLPPGDHASHVHVHGDCSDAARGSAGPHLDFEALAGPREGPPDHVTGDLLTLSRGASGSVRAEMVVGRLRAEDLGELVGRAVVIHERANDPSRPPAGDAGRPIACGVIGVAGPEEGRERARAGTAGPGHPTDVPPPLGRPPGPPDPRRPPPVPRPAPRR